jgi:hypothetical protein
LATGLDIDYLLGRAIPDALDPIVRAAVGPVIPRIGEGGRYRIAHTGRFSNRIAGDLLAFFRNQHLAGALLVIDPDTVRVIYFHRGRVIGAGSDCIFERLGRVLARGGLVEEATAHRLVEREEASGLAAAVAELPPDVARWGIETRVWDIAAALFLVHGGHFVIVEGTPDLVELPAVDLAPTDLALEGLRRYDEWRHGDKGPDVCTSRPEPEARPPEAPVVRARPAVAATAAADELLARLRELG